MKHRAWMTPPVLAAAAFLMIGASSASAADVKPASPLPAIVKDGKIGFVLTSRRWAVLTDEGKEECPQGFNVGNQEQFAQLFPKDGPKHTVVESQLMRESHAMLPDVNDPDPFPFIQVSGTHAFGLNLDGKIGPNDFTSPDGEKGVDNQLFRAVGCVANFHGPSVQSIWWYENEYVRRYISNRLLIEISGVDSLENDDDVTVRTYRGTNDLLSDAVGDANGEVILAGGTQGIDERWGKFVQNTWKGKIVNGTLITEPADLQLPLMGRRNISNIVPIKGMRFKLKLTPEKAEGVMAGYTDIEKFEVYINNAWPQTYQEIGRMPTASMFHVIDRLADGYPDPKTGKMTAISSALKVKFAQVFIVHPENGKERPVASANERKLPAASSTAGQ